MSERPADVRRLLVRAPNWLGDAVMALPAMGAVRSAFADAHITVAGIPSVAPLFQENTNAAQDELLIVPEPRREAGELGRHKFDAALLLPNSFRSALSARHAGVPERWGYSAGFRRLFLTRAVRRPRARVHQSEYYLELVRGLGLDAPPTPPRVAVKPETLSRADALLKEKGISSEPLRIGFAPGAAYGHAKRWPPRRVADLIVRLSRERGAACILFGAAGDRPAGREIESLLPADVRVVNLIARTDLRLLAGLMARCAAMVSNDSGAMHLAGAVGTPLVAIFGPTDERVTAPLGGGASDPERPGPPEPDVLTHSVFCRPCMLRDCPIDHRCMRGISVETVFSVVARRLEGTA
jgi:heptosyltransferase-2